MSLIPFFNRQLDSQFNGLANPSSIELNKEHKKTEQIVLRAKAGVVSAFLGVLFLAWVSWPFTEWTNIMLWIATICIPDAITFITASRFSKIPRTMAAICYWQRRQTILHVAAGIGWGLAPALLLSPATPAIPEFMLYITIATVIAFSVNTMANSQTTLCLFPLSVAIPSQLYLFAYPPNQYEAIIAMAMPIAAFLAIFMGWIAHKQLTAQIHAVVLSEHLSNALKEANATIEEKNQALNKKNNVLTIALTKLDTLANLDELTGLSNRRFILARIEEISIEVNRYNKICSIAMIDIDHFKSINDQHGHAVGDQVLQAFSHYLLNMLRDGDFLARYGGEEFLLLLPYANASLANSIMERLRLSIPDPLIEGAISLSSRFSCGVTQMLPGETIQTCINRADSALYKAKKNGRNQVVTI